MKIITTSILIIALATIGFTQINTDTMKISDNSNKTILARGCDPYLSAMAAREIPKLLGNPSYIPTTTDEEFFALLKTKKWSMIYFAPGACRFSAAKRRIPGSNEVTKTWTLAEYKELIYKYQGDDVTIAESTSEQEAIGVLQRAIEQARVVE
jgi:hypothetical protein